MTDKERSIHKIISSKNKPHLDFNLKSKTEKFTNKLFYTLFDANACVAKNIEQLELDFNEIYKLACRVDAESCGSIWNSFLSELPEILEDLNLDAQELVNSDPASNNIEEVYLAYPGFFAIAIYRLSHKLYKLKTPLIPRLMSEYAHSKTGTDIHPGATIGKSFFIDHATGTVIGETCLIKNHVKIYQGVTLGALQVSKDLKDVKRHPTVEDNVTIYANATILGGETIIGKNSIIGGNVWITESIPENSLVYHKAEIRMKQKK
ncbi:serine acetyltransferase [Lutibacter sp. A80]|uniref:serine O-acetyltransferase EpsC n=1 Tax=Lutibacter sp. A80 TaxID=2918453 RepID=UPI001F064FF9|nr:serine O-acetyltransferase EpsC [Lutibacter sp. A80]UMB62142.1 serine acetyltransferase [Lutibacter sp. A80]